MRKNRIIAFIWIGIIALIVCAMIGYVIYAQICHPYQYNSDDAKNVGHIVVEILEKIRR